MRGVVLSPVEQLAMAEMSDIAERLDLPITHTQLSLLAKGATHALADLLPKPAKAEMARNGEVSDAGRQLIALLAAGLDDTEVGVRIGVKADGVRYRVSRLLNVLDVRNRSQLVAVAARLGWLDGGAE